MKCYLLDACAIIAFLNDEAGADKVQWLLDDLADGDCDIYISAAQKIEVYYDQIKIGGVNHADTVLKHINATGIQTIDTITDDMIRDAGQLKAAYKMSFADCLGLSAAVYMNCIFVTADHHELDALEQNESIQFYWIR